MNHKKIGFTLSELLIALSIISIIGALSIPRVFTNLHNKTLTNQIKSMIGSIQEIAHSQLVVTQTKNLADTDFNDADKIMSDKHFDIAKVCDSSNNDCWKDSKGNDVVHKNIKNDGTVIKISDGKTVVLKNGAIITYKIYSTTALGNDKGNSFGIFEIDVNGTDKPNIVGRDYFRFYVSEKGDIVPNSLSESISKDKCLADTKGFDCTNLLINSNWEMNY